MIASEIALPPMSGGLSASGNDIRWIEQNPDKMPSNIRGMLDTYTTWFPFRESLAGSHGQARSLALSAS